MESGWKLSRTISSEILTSFILKSRKKLKKYQIAAEWFGFLFCTVPLANEGSYRHPPVIFLQHFVFQWQRSNVCLSWGNVSSNALKTLCDLIILNLLLQSQLPGHSPFALSSRAAPHSFQVLNLVMFKPISSDNISSIADRQRKCKSWSRGQQGVYSYRCSQLSALLPVVTWLMPLECEFSL